MVGVALYFHYQNNVENNISINIQQEPEINFFTNKQHLGWLHEENKSHDMILYFDQSNATFFALPTMGDNIRMNLNVTPDQMKNGGIINHNGFNYTIEFIED